MISMNAVKRFWASDEGAVTVDWVVLTSAVVGMGIAVMLAVGSGSVDFANKVNQDLETDVRTAVDNAVK